MWSGKRFLCASIVAMVLAPLLGCGTSIGFGTHATKPMSPADGAGDWEIAGGPTDVPPRVPGPELAQPEPNMHPVIYRESTPVPKVSPAPVWPASPSLPTQ